MKRLIKKVNNRILTAENNIYPTKNDVPYNYKKYVLQHDGYVDVDFLNDAIAKFDGVLGDAEWDKGSNWDTDYQYKYSKTFYLDEIANEFNISTTVLIELKEVGVDTIANTKTSIYKYDTTGRATIKVKAGSKSAFDSSDKLYLKEKFENYDITGMNDFIKYANQTIANNVNPNANHNKSSEEFNEAQDYVQNYSNQ